MREQNEEETNLNEKREISSDKDIMTWPLALKRESSVDFFPIHINFEIEVKIKDLRAVSF